MGVLKTHVSARLAYFSFQSRMVGGDSFGVPASLLDSVAVSAASHEIDSSHI
jgi:hypothetical protein